MTLTLRIGFKIELVCERPTAAQLRLRTAPSSSMEVNVEDTLIADAAGPIHTFCELDGNNFSRLDLPAGRSAIAAEALVQCSSLDRVHSESEFVPVAALPAHVLPFLQESRFCAPNVLRRVAHELLGDTSHPADALKRIMDIAKQPCGAPPIENGIGYADRGASLNALHLAISLCRARNVPARLVMGYLGNRTKLADGFDAWVEVYASTGWQPMTPEAAMRDCAFVQIGNGRDAAELVPIELFGAPASVSFCVTQERLPTELRIQELAHAA